MDSNHSLFSIIFNCQSTNTARTLQSYLPVDIMTRQVNLNAGFEDACSRGLHLNNSQIFYIDFLNKVNVFLGVYPFAADVNIKLENVMNNSIQVNYRCNSSPSGQMIDQVTQNFMNKETTHKNKKVKQRTIKQAIEAVQQWRAYYDTPDQTGRRMYTLDQAAKRVGIAKKTLDDYYNHLKIAQQFDFNIQRFIEAKIGVLRKFVKLAKQSGKQALQKLMPQFIVETNIQIYWNKLNEA